MAVGEDLKVHRCVGGARPCCTTDYLIGAATRFDFTGDAAQNNPSDFLIMAGNGTVIDQMHAGSSLEGWGKS